MSESENAKPVRNERLQRFEIQLDGKFAFIDFRQISGRLFLTHTEVPREWEGKGIANRLAHAAFDFARNNNLRIVPRCGYIAAWVRRHPEQRDLVEQA
jgi:predicted GNAT family acetyltransferase